MRFQIRRARHWWLFGRNRAPKHLAGCISSAPCGPIVEGICSRGELNMQLDKALQFAVVQSWEDLARGTRALLNPRGIPR